MQVDQYVTFVSLLPTNAAVTIGPYTDSIGNYFFLHGSTNDRGEDVPYKVKFKRSKRHVRFHKDKKDKYGTSFVTWLRNHPRCAGSPFGLPEDLCWFKEANSEKDAKIAFEDYKIRNTAENYVLSLKGKELERVASVLGFSGSASVIHTNILHYASKNPAEFLSKVKDPNLEYEALFRDALSEKVISKRGFRFVYNEVHLGNDEEAVIAKLAEDKDLRLVIQKAISSASGKKA
jgi:hypothetical protein